ADPGACRLRDAIAAANTNAPVNGCFGGLAEAPDLIMFAVNGKINLGSELVPTGSVAIRGPGATKLTLSGQNASRIFNPGAGGDYTLSGLTIANGNGNGGGIVALFLSSLAVSECVFRNNVTSNNGGALVVQG